MKILALDLGSRRTGLAMAQESFVLGRGTVAGWDGWEKMIAALHEIVDQEKPKILVAGVPHSVSGEAAEHIRKLIQLLQKELKLPIKEVDETLTSVEARQRFSKNLAVDDDEEAAKIILEDYLRQHPADK